MMLLCAVCVTIFVRIEITTLKKWTTFLWMAYYDELSFASILMRILAFHIVVFVFRYEIKLHS